MLVLAVAGFVAYGISGVAATQLDGVISLINFGAALIASKLAVTAGVAPTREHPYGRLALENLYVLFRSLMLLGVIVVAVITNAVKIIDYLATRQAEEPHFGIAAIYTAFAAAVCMGLVLYHRGNNKTIADSSKLLKVESQASMIEGMVSLAICASLILVAVIPEGTAVTSADFNIKAIADSIIVLTVCAVLFREPLHDVRTEFGRLAGKRSDPDLDEDIKTAVDSLIEAHSAVDDFGFRLVDMLSVRRGKSSEVDLRISYNGAMTVAQQDTIRLETARALEDLIGPVRVHVVFTEMPIHESAGQSR